MGYGSRAFLAGGLGFAVSFVVACGGGNGLLSANQAADLSNQLNTLSAAVASGQCGGARAAANSFSDSVKNLPSTVNTTLAQNLAQGASTVSQLAARDCLSSSSTSSTTSTSTTPTTKTSTTSTSTSTSTSSTSSTTSTSTTPTPTSNSSTTTTTTSSPSATTPVSSSTTSTSPTGGTGIGTNRTGNGGSG